MQCPNKNPLFEHFEVINKFMLISDFIKIKRLIFEDASLKKDVEKYIGEGFQTAIKGFSINDWGIRNSSLMLFSSMTKRTFGSNKTADQNSVKNQMNIVEFFTRAPQLLDFFLKEINDFLKQSKDFLLYYELSEKILNILRRLSKYHVSAFISNSSYLFKIVAI